MDYSRMTGDGRKSRNADRVQSMVANPEKTAGASGLTSAHKLTGPKDVEENNLASGGRAKPRADRYARGGAVKKPSTNISINLTMAPKAKDEEKPNPLEALLANAPPPSPPMPPPGPMAGPGGPPMPPPGMPGMKTGGVARRAAGGSVKYPHMTAGSVSGEGRLEKTDAQRRLRKVLGDTQST